MNGTVQVWLKDDGPDSDGPYFFARGDPDSALCVAPGQWDVALPDGHVHEVPEEIAARWQAVSDEYEAVRERWQAVQEEMTVLIRERNEMWMLAWRRGSGDVLREAGRSA